MDNNQGHQHCGLNVGLSFVLGGLMGTGLALLFAPNPARKLVNRLKEWSAI